jgi:predicted metal-dependent phosphoesterase TrpH
MMITLELHTHTHYSKDCLTPPEKYIAECRRKGLDRVAVTDHNTTAGAFKLKAMAPDLIIVGEEIKTDSGEIIAYFLTEEVPMGLPVREAIDRVRAQGGIVGVSHPADRLRKEAMGIDRLLPIRRTTPPPTRSRPAMVRPASPGATRTHSWKSARPRSRWSRSIPPRHSWSTCARRA